ncbi:hypothetical protein [Streptomyces zhihengii]
MDTAFTALAASGATTLVSLMVTDSWVQARALVGRLFARTHSSDAALTHLEAERARLLADDDAATIREITDRCQVLLRHLLESGSATGEELHDVLSSLRQLANECSTPLGPVHNTINGGVQHGPVIQSGRITGLTFHAQGPGSPPPSQHPGANDHRLTGS